MRVVFDICVPRPLRKHLPGHEIRAAEPLFDVLRLALKVAQVLAGIRAEDFIEIDAD